MVKMTEEQTRAAVVRGKNILVNAAAGSGKTKVLTERIIGMVSDTENPVDIDSLLVVTFTKAAASEMRERISSALAKKSAENPDSSYLKKQLILLNHADITTIDAFCLNVVRSNFHLLDLDPSFAIINSDEAKIIQDEIMEEVFEDNYSRMNDGFLKLAERYSSKHNDSKLSSMVSDIYQFVSSASDIDKEIEYMRDLYSCSFEDSKYIKYIYDEISETLEKIVNRYKKILDILYSYPDDLKSAVKMREIIGNELSVSKAMKEASDNKDWELAYRHYSSMSFATAAWKGMDKDWMENARKACKDEFQSLSKYFYYKNTDEISERIQSCYKPVISALLDITKEFSDAYNVKKKNLNKFEFSDIERMCLSIMKNEDGTDSDICISLREKYSEILIDEYQDSNQLQEDIFSGLSNGRNMFMVGDMKQSIYGFRGSDPSFFKRKCSFPTDLNSPEPNVKITLSKNFRSRSGCINAINELFENIMTESCGEIDYDEEQKLYVGNMNYDDTKNNPDMLKAEMDLILTEKNSDTKDDEEQNDEQEELNNIRIEARFAAKRIHELKNSGYHVLDKNTNTYRPVENNDIAVLIRAVKSGDAAAVYADELNKCGISAYAQSLGYFSKTEVRTILALLKTINNPQCDIPLIAVMCSPLYNISDNRIAEIQIFNKKDSIYNNMIAILKKEDDPAIRKITDDIERFREYSKYMPCDKLIWTVYEETGFYNVCAVLPGGEERCANLALLFERARVFENSGFKGLFNFIKFIERMISKKSEMSAANLIGENHNVVRVMSIHKSKGLEFPVVILAQGMKSFNTKDLSETIIFDKELGMGIDYYVPEEHYRYSTIIKNAVKRKKKIAAVSEEMRILYVALTRAREKIIVTAVNREDKFDEESYKTLRPSSASSYAGWIINTALKSGVYWDLNKINIKDVTSFKYEEDNVKKVTEEIDIDTSCIFDFDYKYKSLTNMPAKISVTELKRRAEPADDASPLFENKIIAARPKFLRSESMTPAEKGTLTHLFMRNIILKKDIDIEYIDSEIQRMTEKGIFSEKEAEYIDKGRICTFFNSDIGRRMINSENVCREVKFGIPVSVSLIENNISEEHSNETVLLQGTVDCYFEEKDGIVLIDYKTDYYTDKSEIKKKYSKQIEYYKLAVENLTKKCVKESYLYLFFRNDVI